MRHKCKHLPRRQYMSSAKQVTSLVSDAASPTLSTFYSDVGTRYRKLLLLFALPYSLNGSYIILKHGWYKSDTVLQRGHKFVCNVLHTLCNFGFTLLFFIYKALLIGLSKVLCYFNRLNNYSYWCSFNLGKLRFAKQNDICI